MNSKNRIWDFDYLRIISSFFVVMLHVSAVFWYNRPVQSMDWMISNCLNIVTRISVPLFVMISGALFLSPQKEIPLRALWTKNIFRLFFLFLFWNTLYAILPCFENAQDKPDISEVLQSILSGRYHLWFLPMLMGLYALIPFLRTWLKTASKTELQYFMLLFFFFQVIRTSIQSFFNLQAVVEFLEYFDWAVVCSYLGYFILGYYLFHIGISPKTIKYLTIGMPFYYLGNILFSTLLSLHFGYARNSFFDSYGVFTFLTTITVFCIFTKKKEQDAPSAYTKTLLNELSKSTLGIYLMHLMIMESSWLQPLYELPVMIAIPLISLTTFCICAILTVLLRKLPFVGKWIV